MTLPSLASHCANSGGYQLCRDWTELAIGLGQGHIQRVHPDMVGDCFGHHGGDTLVAFSGQGAKRSSQLAGVR